MSVVQAINDKIAKGKRAGKERGLEPAPLKWKREVSKQAPGPKAWTAAMTKQLLDEELG